MTDLFLKEQFSLDDNKILIYGLGSEDETFISVEEEDESQYDNGKRCWRMVK